MKETIVRITTTGTEGLRRKTYEFPRHDGEPNPRLWAVSLAISKVEEDGRDSTAGAGIKRETVYLERQVLVDHGLLPWCAIDEKPPVSAPTAEDLILQLLECVGVFPGE